MAPQPEPFFSIRQGLSSPLLRGFASAEIISPISSVSPLHRHVILLVHPVSGGGGDKDAPVSLMSDSWLGPAGPAPWPGNLEGVLAVLPRRTNPSPAFQGGPKPLPLEDLYSGPVRDGQF